MKKKKWTNQEEELAWELYKKGYKHTDIANLLNREYNSISIKLKRLKKDYNEYNLSHIEEKYEINDKYMKTFKKDCTILDLFCGENSYYVLNKYNNVITNDINTEIDAIYHKDADILLQEFIANGKKFDIVDIDPFGAGIPYLLKALKVAEKGVVITLGELGHKRWKRIDFISRYYPSIQKIEDFTLENMIKDIITLAKREGFLLKPMYYKDWNNIARVWFLKEDIENREPIIKLFNCDYKSLINEEYFKNKNICVIINSLCEDNLNEIECLNMIKEIYDKINNLVIIQYPQELYKTSHHIGKIPNKICTWVYNANSYQQHRDIAFFNINPIFSQIKKDTDLCDWWYINNDKIDYSDTPIEVIKNIIKTIPKEYTIFNPLCQTGTVGVACIELGYDFIGCEIDKEYYEIARERLGFKDVFKIIK